MKPRALVLVVLALSAVFAAPASAQRQRFSLDPGWRFHLGDAADAERPAFDDRAWRRLDLPHDWSIESTPRQDAPGGGRIGYFATGIGWYRKAFRLPAGARGRRAWLEIDGCSQNCEVWVNGHSVGRRPYAYASYMYDITARLVNGVNTIAVRADNADQPNSRWYQGSGLYRHVWLTLVAPLHVGHWGTYVTTPRVDSASADVAVRTTVVNDHPAERRFTLRSLVLDSDGREAARGEMPFVVPAGQSATLAQRLVVERPRLWDVVSPALYVLRSEIVEDGRVLDTLATTFGIRTIEYHADRGFLLNGRRVKMWGVNLHHDAGGVGAAVPERMWERRLERLRDMGVNAIRTSHNPPAAELLDLADRMGFLVMNEAFDEWTMGKVPFGYHRWFDEWVERDLTDFIHRDRNHPSVVLWSAGNEIGEQTRPNGAAVLRRLLDVFHREDPTRPVTTGNDNIAAEPTPATAEFLGALDIVGYNYVDRWRERRETFAEQDRRDHPTWRMIGTESGNVFESRDERYSLGDDPARVRPNYTFGMMTAERRLKWIYMRDWFAGDFIWTGIDYLGEATWPFHGFASGPLDIIGHPKASFYLYQSLWTTPRRPVLHLFPHWSWPGREGQVIPVLAYTSCNIVELFLNGRSLGEKRMEFPAQGTSGGWNTYARPVANATTNDLHLSWDVPYEPGVLRAVGRRSDNSATCEDTVRTAGAPARLRLTADRDTITTTAGDVAHVEFDIVDSAGTILPYADSMVTFAVEGGRILALDNANLRDHSPFQATSRRAYAGRGLAVIRADAPGEIRVSASVAGLPPARLTIRVTAGAARPTIGSAR